MQNSLNTGVPRVNDVQPSQCQAEALNHSQAQPQLQSSQQPQMPLRPIIAGGTAITMQQLQQESYSNQLSFAKLNAGVQCLLQGSINNLSPVVQSVAPQNPSSAKDWYENVTQEQRRQVAQNIVLEIFPTTDLMNLQDRRMLNLLVYAQKIEGDVYKMANSQDEYYHLIVEKIYKIKVELEERRQRRIEQQKNQQIQQDESNIGHLVGNTLGTHSERTSDQGSAQGKKFAFNSQKTNDSIDTKIAVDADNTEINSEVKVEQEGKIEIKQEPMDEIGLSTELSTSTQGEASAAKVPATPSTSIEIKQVSIDTPQPPPKLEPTF